MSESNEPAPEIGNGEGNNLGLPDSQPSHPEADAASENEKKRDHLILERLSAAHATTRGKLAEAAIGISLAGSGAELLTTVGSTDDEARIWLARTLLGGGLAILAPPLRRAGERLVEWSRQDND